MSRFLFLLRPWAMRSWEVGEMIALRPSGLVYGAEPRVRCTAASANVDGFLQ